MKIPSAKISFPESDIDRILEQVRDILSTGWLSKGKYTTNLENTFSKMFEISHGIATNSGTSAIEICLRILNSENGEIICPTNTMISTPVAILHSQGTVKFVDIEDTYISLDPDKLKKAISSETKIVIIVHIGGIISPRIPEIIEICNDNNLILIEDAAHAHGSQLKGKFAGSFGRAAIFSFYATKLITGGEGGIIITNDEKIDMEARIFRNVGKDSVENFHVKLGYNWRISEINAAIILTQLSRMKEFIANRRKMAKIYDKELQEINGIIPVLSSQETYSNYFKYIALLEDGIDKEELKTKIREKHGVNLSSEVYAIPCHLQPIMNSLPGATGEFPVATAFSKKHICLPIFSTMTEEEVYYVIDSLSKELT